MTRNGRGTEAVQQYPRDAGTPAKMQASQADYEAGLAWRDGKLAEAEELVRAAMRLDPDRSELWAQRLSLIAERMLGALPAETAFREGSGWAEPKYGLRSGRRGCAEPHAGQSRWQIDARASEVGGTGRCRDGHPVTAPLCQQTAERFAGAGMAPGDPDLAKIRQWNASVIGHGRAPENTEPRAEPEAEA